MQDTFALATRSRTLRLSYKSASCLHDSLESVLATRHHLLVPAPAKMLMTSILRPDSSISASRLHSCSNCESNGCSWPMLSPLTWRLRCEPRRISLARTPDCFGTAEDKYPLQLLLAAPRLKPTEAARIVRRQAASELQWINVHFSFCWPPSRAIARLPGEETTSGRHYGKPSQPSPNHVFPLLPTRGHLLGYRR